MERLVQSEDPSLGGCHHAKKAFEEASPAREGRFSPMGILHKSCRILNERLQFK